MSVDPHDYPGFSDELNHPDRPGLAGEASTLDASSERASERAEPEAPPEKYVSLRVTIPHDQWDVIEQKIEDFEWYISYPHLGKNGTNPHFHVFLPGNKRDADRVRDRLKKSGLAGNKQFSIKCHENGVLAAIQYGSREKTTPKTRGDVAHWIAAAPEWLVANLQDNLNPFTRKRKADDMMDGMEPITQKNCLYKVWAYRRDYLVKDPKSDKHSDMGDVILRMLDSLKYYIDPAFARTGLPNWYLDVFKSSCKVGHLTFARDKKQWLDVLFRPVTSRW